jgi:hypothetical protein
MFGLVDFLVALVVVDALRVILKVMRMENGQL